MAKSVNVRRKAVVAREDLVDRMSVIAKEQGCSLFELVNELFKLMIISDKLNFSLRHVVEERNFLDVAKRCGFVLGLERLWYDMADIAYKKDKNGALKSWLDSGAWFAARYVSSGHSLSFVQFKDDLVAFTWNAPEFKFELEGDKASVRVTSPRFTEAYSFLFASFLVGALESFGYCIVCRDVSRGVIRLDAVRGAV
ncbi:MAG: hypothetical protein FWH37_08860 [Candidatus Bathyarchaeota archaeon]|nr:hypothetical protein [Candidatus Termiticorpusculum sp.]